MAIQIPSNFRVKTNLPLDDKTLAATIAIRDAIPTAERYIGMEVYVIETGLKYRLAGGVLNTDWVTAESEISDYALSLLAAGDATAARAAIDAADTIHTHVLADITNLASLTVTRSQVTDLLTSDFSITGALLATTTLSVGSSGADTARLKMWDQTGTAYRDIFWDQTERVLKLTDSGGFTHEILHTGGNQTIDANLTIAGNLTVSGTTTTVNSNVVAIGDAIITLNADITAIPPTEDAGLEIARGLENNVSLIWDESTDRWAATRDGITHYDLLTTEGSQTVLGALTLNSLPINGGTGDVFMHEGMIDDGISPLAIAFEARQMKENGFDDRNESDISFDDLTRVFTIAPVLTDFTFYVNHTKFVKNTPQALQIPDVEGMHFIYFDLTGNLTSTQVFSQDIIILYAFVALVYWDATNKTAITLADERHGNTMDSATHLYNHETIGTRYGNGLQPGDITVDGNGSLAIHAQISVTSGTIWDEDIEISIASKALPASIPFLYKTGANGYWRKIAGTGYVCTTTGTGRAAYNQWTGAVWQLTEVSNTKFTLMHLYATDDLDQPFFWVLGQNEYNTAASAREGALTELINLDVAGLPVVEYKSIATFIIQTNNAYSNAVKSAIQSVDTGVEYVDWRFTDVGIVAQVTGATVSSAADVSFTPSTQFNLLSTDVQAALEEVITVNGGQTINGNLELDQLTINADVKYAGTRAILAESANTGGFAIAGGTSLSSGAGAYVIGYGEANAVTPGSLFLAAGASGNLYGTVNGIGGQIIFTGGSFTWNGDDVVHTGGGQTITDNLAIAGASIASLRVSGTVGRLELSETDAPVNQKNWVVAANVEKFIIGAFDDAWSSSTAAFTIDRTDNTIDIINLLGASNQSNGNEIIHAGGGQTINGRLTLAEHLDLGDSGRLRIGAAQDLQLLVAPGAYSQIITTENYLYSSAIVGHIWQIAGAPELGLTNLILYPTTDLGLSLGSTSFRFNQLHVNSIDISGPIIANLFGTGSNLGTLATNDGPTDGFYKWAGVVLTGTMPDNLSASVTTQYGQVWQLPDGAQSVQFGIFGESSNGIAIRRKSGGTSWHPWTHVITDVGGQTIDGALTLVGNLSSANSSNWDAAYTWGDHNFVIANSSPGAVGDLDTFGMGFNSNYNSAVAFINDPAGLTYGLVRTVRDTSDSMGYQLAFDINHGSTTSGTQWFRTKNTSGWGTWKELITSAGGQTINGTLNISTGTNHNLSISSLAHDSFINEGVGITFSRTSNDVDLMAIGVVDSDKLMIASRSGMHFMVGGGSLYSNTTIEALRIDSTGSIFAGGDVTITGHVHGASFSTPLSGIQLQLNATVGLRILPSTTVGGWARGVIALKQSDSSTMAGAGFLGTSEAVNSFGVGVTNAWYEGVAGNRFYIDLDGTGKTHVWNGTGLSEALHTGGGQGVVGTWNGSGYQAVDLNNVQGDERYNITTGSTNVPPSFGATYNGTVWNYSVTNTNNGVQFAAKTSSPTTPILSFRVQGGNVWGSWRDIIHTGGGQTIAGTVTFGNHTYQADNVRSYFGTGNDAYIEHTGGVNQFVNLIGAMIINQRAPSDFLYLRTFDSLSANKEGIIIGGATPTVRLHYNGTEVLETSSRGVDASGVAIGQAAYPWGGANTIGVQINPTSPNSATFIDMRRYTGVGTSHRSVAIGQENNGGTWDLFIYADQAATNTYATTKKLRVPTAASSLVQVADSGGTLQDVIHAGGGQTIGGDLFVSSATSRTETTSTRVMRVTDFGLGGIGILKTNINTTGGENDVNQLISAASTAIGAPSGAARGGVLQLGYAPTERSQIYADPLYNKLYVRHRYTVTADAWKSWNEILTSAGGQNIGTSGDSAVSKTTFHNQVLNVNNANVDGPNFDVQTTNKSINEYAYKVTRNGGAQGGILVTGEVKTWDGSSIRDVLHTGGGQTIAGTLTLNNSLVIQKNSTYNNESSGAIRIQDTTNDTGMLLGADAASDIAYIQSLDPGTSYGTRNLAINPNGSNVGIGLVTPTEKLHVNGNIKIEGTATTTGKVVTHSFVTSSQGFMTNPNNTNQLFMPIVNGGMYSGANNDLAYIKIKLPVLWTNTMLSFWVDIYNYTAGTSTSIFVGGYLYATPSTWINTFVTQMSAYNQNNIEVTFGHDGVNSLLLIRQDVGDWDYPQVTVRDFRAGYAGANEVNWDGAWSISTVANLTGITTNTVWTTIPTTGVLRGYSNNEIGILDNDIQWAWKFTHDTDHRWYINNTEYAKLSTAGFYLQADNRKLHLGAANDLQVYHSSGNAYITNSTGQLVYDTPAGGHVWRIAGTNELQLTAASLRPLTAEGLSLGDASYQWGTAHFGNGIVFTGKADHPVTGKSQIWVKDTTLNTLMFTDNANNDKEIRSTVILDTPTALQNITTPQIGTWYAVPTGLTNGAVAVLINFQVEELVANAGWVRVHLAPTTGATASVTNGVGIGNAADSGGIFPIYAGGQAWVKLSGTYFAFCITSSNTGNVSSFYLSLAGYIY